MHLIGSCSFLPVGSATADLWCLVLLTKGCSFVRKVSNLTVCLIQFYIQSQDPREKSCCYQRRIQMPLTSWLQQGLGLLLSVDTFAACSWKLYPLTNLVALHGSSWGLQTLTAFSMMMNLPATSRTIRITLGAWIILYILVILNYSSPIFGLTRSPWNC